MKLRFKSPAHWSIRGKLTFIAMATTTLALILTIGGLAIFEYVAVRNEVRSDQEMRCEIIGGNSTAAILFNRPDDATSILATLGADDDTMDACVFDADGKLLATFVASNQSNVQLPAHPGADGSYFTMTTIVTFRPVKLDGKTIGTIYMRSNLHDIYNRLELFAWISPLILILASAAGLLLIRRLQRSVTTPLLGLAQTAQRVSTERDYSLRAPKFANDEIGQLADALNHMLEGIRERDQQIQLHLREVKSARDQLETRVDERTTDLKQANADLQAEMLQRRESEKKRAEMQANLVEASRRAGMADVATGVLHNVGNVLNSVNVSTQIVHDAVKTSRVAVFQKAALMLQEHASDLPAFLTADARGKTLPAFLSKLAGALADEQGVLLKEIDSLAGNIAHIREIVAMQQSLSRVSGVQVPVTLGELIEDAVKINSAGLQRHQVAIQRDFDPSVEVVLDRHKVLQILINLISNAKYAVNGTTEPVRRVCIRAAIQDDRLRMVIIDNGVGIDPAQMNRIFGFGFTTKKNGHGFGLHSSALAAREMGGSLAAASDGPGKGASFTLDLPLSKEPAHV